jgi:hypothetical protein
LAGLGREPDSVDGVWPLDGRLLVLFPYEGSDACQEPEPDWKIYAIPRR